MVVVVVVVAVVVVVVDCISAVADAVVSARVRLEVRVFATFDVAAGDDFVVCH